MNEQLKICAIIGNRANYASLKSVLLMMALDEYFDLHIICACSAVEDKYGNVSSLIEKESFNIDFKLNTLVTGDSCLSMVKSTSITLSDVAVALSNVKPDCVLIVGDRFEVMAFAIAAAYMNIPIIHTMGGEASGTIDESIRHAITKLAHIHFVATEKSKQNVIQLGENKDLVFNVGCPRIDEVKNVIEHNSKKYIEEINNSSAGPGEDIDFDKDFLLVSFHPVTSELNTLSTQIRALLKALTSIKIQTIMLWPNADAGTDMISREIRIFREKKINEFAIKFIKNIPFEHYINLMKHCACLAGNTSSGIREGSFIGTPFVNIGTRQDYREKAENTLSVQANTADIVNAIKTQLNRHFESSTLYGNGTAAEKMIFYLKNIDVKHINPQKHFNVLV